MFPHGLTLAGILLAALPGPGVLKGEFAIAPPGSPEAFKPHLAWESHRGR